MPICLRFLRFHMLCMCKSTSSSTACNKFQSGKATNTKGEASATTSDVFYYIEYVKWFCRQDILIAYSIYIHFTDILQDMLRDLKTSLHINRAYLCCFRSIERRIDVVSIPVRLVYKWINLSHWYYSVRLLLPPIFMLIWTHGYSSSNTLRMWHMHCLKMRVTLSTGAYSTKGACSLTKKTQQKQPDSITMHNP